MGLNLAIDLGAISPKNRVMNVVTNTAIEDPTAWLEIIWLNKSVESVEIIMFATLLHIKIVDKVNVKFLINLLIIFVLNFFLDIVLFYISVSFKAC